MTFDEFVERLGKAFPEDEVEWYSEIIHIKDGGVKQVTVNFDLRKFKGKDDANI